jgi:hypothetical protein
MYFYNSGAQVEIEHTTTGNSKGTFMENIEAAIRGIDEIDPAAQKNAFLQAVPSESRGM